MYDPRVPVANWYFTIDHYDQRSAMMLQMFGLKTGSMYSQILDLSEIAKNWLVKQGIFVSYIKLCHIMQKGQCK